MSFRDPIVDVNTSTTTFIVGAPFFAGQEQVMMNNIKLTHGVEYSMAGPGGGAYDTITVPGKTNQDTLVISIFNSIYADTIADKLDELLVAATGSWVWDKNTDVMTMINSSGDEKFKFTVSDDNEQASRERRQDLEM